MGCHCTVILGRWLSVRAPNSPHLGVPLRPVITDSGPALEPFRNDKIAYVNRGGASASDRPFSSRPRPAATLSIWITRPPPSKDAPFYYKKTPPKSRLHIQSYCLF